jgi:DNA-binding PadR family transcriptional regulator
MAPVRNDRPLKPQWFHILFALAEGALHGLGIQRAILERTEGKMRLWPAMLYRSLDALVDEGLIHTVDGPDRDPPDERREYYTLTPKGRKRLNAEVEMRAGWVAAARALRPEPAGGGQ